MFLYMINGALQLPQQAQTSASETLRDARSPKNPSRAYLGRTLELIAPHVEGLELRALRVAIPPVGEHARHGQVVQGHLYHAG